MKTRWSTLVATTLLGIGLASAQEGRVRTNAPVQNYTLSFFSDEGYPRVRIEGDSADLSDLEKIRLTGMHLELYSGDAERVLETTLDAPVAILERGPELVHGPDTVHLKRTDLELSGANWNYDHRERRVQVRRDARVVFNMPLEGLLK
jgi:hypothetical protein